MAESNVYTETIARTECIGNSLVKINNNFKNLDARVYELVNAPAPVAPPNIIQTPVGSIMLFPCITPPAGWLILDGQIISRAEYTDLWAFAQNSGNIVELDSLWYPGAFSKIDVSSDQFRIPDLRGYFIRGFGRNTDGTSSSSIGSVQTDAILNHTHTGTTSTESQGHIHTGVTGAESQGHSHQQRVQGKKNPLDLDQGVTLSQESYLTDFRVFKEKSKNIGQREITPQAGAWDGKTAPNDSSHNHSFATGDRNQSHTHTFTTSAPSNGQAENRPKNIALLYCIKY